MKYVHVNPRKRPTTLTPAAFTAVVPITHKALSTKSHLSKLSGEKHISSFHLCWNAPSRMISFLLLNLGQGPSRTVELGPKGHRVPSYLVDLRPEVCPCSDLYRCHPDGDMALRPTWQSFSPKVMPCPAASFSETCHQPRTHFSYCINFFWEKCLAAGRRIVTLKQS